jgi:hypothetical protein
VPGPSPRHQALRFKTTELIPPLADRGITLSASQVHRLVTGTPERLSLPVLSAPGYLRADGHASSGLGAVDRDAP